MDADDIFEIYTNESPDLDGCCVLGAPIKQGTETVLHAHHMKHELAIAKASRVCGFTC